MEIKYLSAMKSIALDYEYFTLVGRVKAGNILERTLGLGKFVGFITIEGELLTTDELKELLSGIGETFDIASINKLPIVYTVNVKDINNNVHEILANGTVSFIVNNHIHQVLADERGKPIQFKKWYNRGICFDIIHNKAIIKGEIDEHKTFVEDLLECASISKKFTDEVLDEELQIKRAVILSMNDNPYEK